MGLRSVPNTPRSCPLRTSIIKGRAIIYQPAATSVDTMSEGASGILRTHVGCLSTRNCREGSQQDGLCSQPRGQGGGSLQMGSPGMRWQGSNLRWEPQGELGCCGQSSWHSLRGGGGGGVTSCRMVKKAVTSMLECHCPVFERLGCGGRKVKTAVLALGPSRNRKLTVTSPDPPCRARLGSGRG